MQDKALQGRLFYKQSFSIYGGVAGLYDYGPPGTAIKANVTQFWRTHFVFAESMLEIECPAVTPEAVLKPSGHVDRFVDYMVRDAKGNTFRADHLLEAKLEAVIADPKTSADAKKVCSGSIVPLSLVIAPRGTRPCAWCTFTRRARRTSRVHKPHAGVVSVRDPPQGMRRPAQAAEAELVHVGEMDCEALGAKIKEHGLESPEPGGGALTDPFPFNLMFRTSIGPRGDTVGFLRPETAQGIFVSFRDLLYYNGGRLPMAVSQIGQSFRNEISPQQGLLRVREFTQAEIEHFVHPDRKDHPRFAEVADVAPIMASAAVQQEARRPAPMRLGDAVASGVVANETLAFYIGRTYLFMVAIGINPKRMKFRQHLPNEMAHYACGAPPTCPISWIENAM